MRVFHLLSMSQKKNFSLKRKSLATDLGLRSAKTLLSYPGKMWSPRLPGPRPRMWKKEESYASGKKRTQERLNCNRNAKLRREKTGRWSSQHAEEMNTEKILESEQSNVFACFWIGKQTFSRAPLKKWQRLSNFWQILTSLEKIKYGGYNVGQEISRKVKSRHSHKHDKTGSVSDQLLVERVMSGRGQFSATYVSLIWSGSS